ncbi:MAG: hypothetical protein ACLP7P_17530 [Rhodomicrobium sp.]
MTTPEPEAGRHIPPHPAGPGNGRGEIPLTRIYLPFAMVVTFGAFLMVGGYTVGGFMSGIARDKTETEARLGAIEKEVTAIKNILAERAVSPQNCNCRAKQ